MQVKCFVVKPYYRCSGIGPAGQWARSTSWFLLSIYPVKCLNSLLQCGHETLDHSGGVLIESDDRAGIINVDC